MLKKLKTKSNKNIPDATKILIRLHWTTLEYIKNYFDCVYLSNFLVPLYCSL